MRVVHGIIGCLGCCGGQAKTGYEQLTGKLPRLQDNIGYQTCLLTCKGDAALLHICLYSSCLRQRLVTVTVMCLLLWPQVMDELSHINVLYNDTKTELDSCKADQAELEELREMKEDVKRKEKQQQAIIENQVRGVGFRVCRDFNLRSKPAHAVCVCVGRVN